jgi:hypothetical protein
VDYEKPNRKSAGFSREHDQAARKSRCALKGDRYRRNAHEHVGLLRGANQSQAREFHCGGLKMLVV